MSLHSKQAHMFSPLPLGTTYLVSSHICKTPLVGRKMSFLATVFKYGEGTWWLSQTTNPLLCIFNNVIISLWECICFFFLEDVITCYYMFTYEHSILVSIKKPEKNTNCTVKKSRQSTDCSNQCYFAQIYRQSSIINCHIIVINTS